MQHSKTVKSLIAASLFGLMASSTQAMELSLSDVDLNADGKVTEAEIINVIKTHFMSMDKDGDATVSGNEWLAAENAER